MSKNYSYHFFTRKMYSFLYNTILIIILAIGIAIIMTRKEVYKAEKKVLIIFALGNSFYFCYFFLFTLSTFSPTPEDIAFTIWDLSLIFNILFLILWTSNYVLELHKSSRLKYVPLLMFLLLGGIIISQILLRFIILMIKELFKVPIPSLDNFSVALINNNYHYVFINNNLLISIIILSVLIICILGFSQVKGFSNFKDKTVGIYHNVYITILCCNIIVYVSYLITANDLLKHINLILNLTNISFYFYVALKEPSLFVVFTNKLYNFIIFHKSGILLFSYDFEKQQELEESILKGSILIGINHILSNFSNIEDQINTINLRDHGIIFRFNNNLGYATLLIAKHRSVLLEKTLDEFNQKFSEKHREILENISGLIDVTKFSQTIDLIKDEFKPYL